MIVVKILVVLFLVAFAIILGGMAAAWRRACVAITHSVAVARCLSGDRLFDPPTIRKLSQKDIIRYTPRWVSARHVTALFFLFLASVLAFILFRWYVAVGIAIGTYVLMELAGFLFPRRDSIYYVAQVYSSFRQSLQIAERFGDDAAASDFQTRLQELDAAYKDSLDNQPAKG